MEGRGKEPLEGRLVRFEEVTAPLVDLLGRRCMETLAGLKTGIARSALVTYLIPKEEIAVTFRAVEDAQGRWWDASSGKELRITPVVDPAVPWAEPARG